MDYSVVSFHGPLIPGPWGTRSYLSADPAVRRKVPHGLTRLEVDGVSQIEGPRSSGYKLGVLSEQLSTGYR